MGPRRLQWALECNSGRAHCVTPFALRWFGSSITSYESYEALSLYFMARGQVAGDDIAVVLGSLSLLAHSCDTHCQDLQSISINFTWKRKARV
jgi:hypothetical protein